jgi:hypothetical protein
MKQVAGRRIEILFALAVLLLAVAIRLPHLSQSLWYDEMTTLVQYVLQPWPKILAARAGDYVPNNHVLHTILAKIVYTLFCSKDSIPPHELILRLPAFIAGSLVPVALAWPLRRREPLLALLLGVVAALHPWLVAFSVEARGYSLLLLLGVIATHCLITRPIAYAVCLALSIYTVPLAVLLVPAHAVVVLILHRSDFRKWLMGASAGVVLAALLYLPMVRGLTAYYSHPYPPTMDYRQFLDWLPRYAMAGIRLPQSSDPLAPPATGAVFWALPTLLIIFGSVVGWSCQALRPMLLTMALATVFGMLLALVDSGATEVRFVPWVLLWFCIAAVAAFLSAPNRIGKIAGVLGLLTLISWQTMQDMAMLPNQPIREGFQRADKLVPPGEDILVLYLGARESIALYGNTEHVLLPAPDTASMLAMQKKALIETGHLPWVIIFFERLAADRDRGPGEARGLWRSLMKNYHLATPRLPARLTPIAIYAPNQTPMARRP